MFHFQRIADQARPGWEQRKVAGAGNRTVNYGIGTLRGILKKYRLWSPIADGVQMLRESHNVGCAISERGRRTSVRVVPALLPSCNTHGNAHIAPRGLAALVAFQFGIPSSKTGRLRVH